MNRLGTEKKNNKVYNKTVLSIIPPIAITVILEMPNKWHLYQVISNAAAQNTYTNVSTH
jgi:hypothetical protein